jgi:hypothetical protein
MTISRNVATVLAVIVAAILLANAALEWYVADHIRECIRL